MCLELTEGTLAAKHQTQEGESARCHDCWTNWSLHNEGPWIKKALERTGEIPGRWRRRYYYMAASSANGAASHSSRTKEAVGGSGNRWLGPTPGLGSFDDPS